MTLITVAANFGFVVQVADRRLTGPSGTLSTEQTKAIHFHLPDADFLVGYTGLAMVGTKPMHRILMELIERSARQGAYKVKDTTEAVTENLTKQFKQSEIKVYQPKHRRLSLMMTGFHRLDQQHHTIVQCLWSNFQEWTVGDSVEAWPEFVFTPFSVRAGETWPTLVQRIGAYRALSFDQIEQEIKPLLAPGKPPVAVRDKIIRVLPNQSNLHPTVGVNANAAILFPNGQTEWSYWTGSLDWQYLLGNTIIATPEQTYLMSDAKLQKSNPVGEPVRTGSPMVVPVVPRRQRCPCGSGKRYKHCHGRR